MQSSTAGRRCTSEFAGANSGCGRSPWKPSRAPPLAKRAVALRPLMAHQRRCTSGSSKRDDSALEQVAYQAQRLVARHCSQFDERLQIGHSVDARQEKPGSVTKRLSLELFARNGNRGWACHTPRPGFVRDGPFQVVARRQTNFGARRRKSFVWLGRRCHTQTRVGLRRILGDVERRRNRRPLAPRAHSIRSIRCAAARRFKAHPGASCDVGATPSPSASSPPNFPCDTGDLTRCGRASILSNRTSAGPRTRRPPKRACRPRGRRREAPAR